MHNLVFFLVVLFFISFTFFYMLYPHFFVNKMLHVIMIQEVDRTMEVNCKIC